jgi:hypothetical protein
MQLPTTQNMEILIDASKEVGLEINVDNAAILSPERRSKSGHKNSKQII